MTGSGEVVKPPVGPAREAELAPSPVECRNGLLEEVKAASMTNRTKTNPRAEFLTPGSLSPPCLPGMDCGFQTQFTDSLTLALFISPPQGEIYSGVSTGSRRGWTEGPEPTSCTCSERCLQGSLADCLSHPAAAHGRPWMLQCKAFALAVPSAWNTLT